MNAARTLEARALLAQLAMVAHGSTARLNTTGLSEPGPLPPGERRPPHEVYRERLERLAPNTAEARRTLSAARAELDAIRRRRAPLTATRTETWTELAERIVTNGEGYTVGEIALTLRCTRTQVRRARLEHDRNPQTGRPVVLAATRTAWESARELHRAGLSLRQIEAIEHIPRATLQRHL